MASLASALLLASHAALTPRTTERKLRYICKGSSLSLAPMKQPSFEAIMEESERLAAATDDFEVAAAFRDGVPPRVTLWGRYDELVDEAWRMLNAKRVEA